MPLLRRYGMLTLSTNFGGLLWFEEHKQVFS